MKVLLLSTYDRGGGAARASFRIFKSIQKLGISAKMLVRTKRTDDHFVYQPSSKFRWLFSDIITLIDNFSLKFYKKRKLHYWTVGWFPNNTLINDIKNLNPDILQLHWVSDGFMPINLLAKINIPIVWRLSDSWAFTGGCHVPFECIGYQTGCGNCPQLNSSKKNDLSHRTFNKKYRNWKNADITIVAPSNWMAKCAKQSLLFANHNIVIIPPGIDMDVFKPMDKAYIRSILNLPVNKKIICFGAINAGGDINKGFNLLCDALKLLKQKSNTDNIEILIIGASEPESKPDFGFNSNYIGRVYDELTLALYYSAADLFVLPSLMENSPNTVIESQACGVPVVAFAAGGALDMITHLSNGYLAQPYSIEDMANGIDWIINQIDPDTYHNLAQRARSYAIENHDINKIGRAYSNLYYQLLNNR